MDNQNILFYSSRCNHSNKALDIIKKNNIKIDLQSIDTLQTMPSFLKVVPTIVIKKDSKILEGKEVFEYLNKQEENNSIQPFFSNEMTGYSDGYSYLDNSSEINHSYEYINSNQTLNSNNSTMDHPTATSTTSPKEDEFNKQLELLKAERTKGIPESIQRR